MLCPACGAENRAGRKFCAECGTPLARACSACGAANEPGERFCGECGASLEAGAPAAAPARAEPESERRLVSVLFADLVGFTAASDRRDPEEVRELLSRYFDTARRVIGRYGGTVEKFIGDAVMAVWGAPVTREDDAERAVRAAIDLVAAVAALGAEVGAPGLGLRAGVTTGEAAVTVGAEGQGMVAGDLVNTASRVQSVAAPGTVLVDEATRRTVEASIACEEAGTHDLKGKAEPVPLWRALRVVAARRGGGRSTGLEAPFVGREGEFRMLRELFHAAADEGKARLVSVVGVAGIGKSRLAWEFEKYVDGLVEEAWWHRGRCLSYGEGVAYWALAEMVRMRARIAEDEPPESALAKLRHTVEEIMLDAEERVWVEPRLQHLLGLAERTAPDREDLFSAWRLFFERLAESSPTILLFEDIQWADSALLDFIEYLLDWSRNHPLYVITLARPEIAERHPTWSAGKRSFTSIFLEPLPDAAIDELLRGLVPGLSEELRARIRARAEGIPLYAVETVRMLLDRGLLERDGNEFRPAGPIDSLEVPETLQALIAARLDGLDPGERRLLEDASVLGKTFTTRALSAVSGLDEDELAPLLGSLVRKEVLSLQTDPRSPERGQYGFLQALVEKVAYDTLARKERKARHLRAAAYFETGMGPDEEEIAEVIAAHYLEAYQAAPDADDAGEIKTKARERLTAAAERAASLAAHEQAQRYFEQAAQLADELRTKAGLLERAGEAARAGGRLDAAETHFESAFALFQAQGESHPAARVSARLGEVLHIRGRVEEAVARMEESFDVLVRDEPDGDLAALSAELARLLRILGKDERATERNEFALEIAESLRLPELVARTLTTKSLILIRRPNEAWALVQQALRIALDHDLVAAALRAYGNLGHLAQQQDRFGEAVRATRDGLALARKRGDRVWEWFLLSNLVEFSYTAGDWEEALQLADQFPDEARSSASTNFPAETLARIHVERGDLDQARALAVPLEGREESADLGDRGYAALALAALARADGRHDEALAAGQEALRALRASGSPGTAVEGFAEAGNAALALGDLGKVDELLDECERLEPVVRTMYLDAHAARLRAHLAERRGERARADDSFETAIALFGELGVPFWLAVTLLEHGEPLLASGRADGAEPLLAEAQEIFERLGVRPWLERLERARAGTLAAAP